LNLRPPAPKAGALPGCATPREIAFPSAHRDGVRSANTWVFRKQGEKAARYEPTRKLAFERPRARNRGRTDERESGGTGRRTRLRMRLRIFCQLLPASVTAEIRAVLVRGVHVSLGECTPPWTPRGRRRSAATLPPQAGPWCGRSAPCEPLVKSMRGRLLARQGAPARAWSPDSP
jgi:hypothetical protein